MAIARRMAPADTPALREMLLSDLTAVAYIAVTLVGQLPLGPATGPAATLAVASSSGVAAAAAAGLVISTASIAGVLLYLAATAAIRPRVSASAVSRPASGG